MTDQKLNEAVAEVLGLESYGSSAEGVVVMEWNTPFDPATDPAAALWALKLFCKENVCWWQMTGGIAVEDLCQIGAGKHGPHSTEKRGAFCEAICRAIVEASA